MTLFLEDKRRASLRRYTGYSFVRLSIPPPGGCVKGLPRGQPPLMRYFILAIIQPSYSRRKSSALFTMRTPASVPLKPKVITSWPR